MSSPKCFVHVCVKQMVPASNKVCQPAAQRHCNRVVSVFRQHQKVLVAAKLARNDWGRKT